MTNESIKNAFDRLWQHTVDNAATKLQEAKDYTDGRIPVVNNGTLTITQNGTKARAFTANSASNVTVDITIPTKLSQLTEDDNHRTVTLDEKTKLKSAITTTEFNQALQKAEAELNKRPVAYHSYEGEYTWTFSGNLADYETIDVSPLLGEPDGVQVRAIKILDTPPSKTELNSISFTFYLDSIDTISPITSPDEWTPLNGIEDIYIPSGIEILYAIYAPVTIDTFTLEPGFWVLHAYGYNAGAGFGALGVYSVNFPNAIVPSAKMSADLIDAEWMAIETQSDLDITISNENADSFELVAGMFPKVSDYAPTIEQIKTGTFTVVLLDGTVQEMPITDDMIYHDDETMPPDMYLFCDALIILGSKVTEAGITLSEGMYSIVPVSDILSDMEASSVNIYIPDVITTPNLLPEKYLPDTVVQAYKKEGYFPFDIEWDGEIGNRENNYEAVGLSQSVGYVKLSDLTPSKEELMQGTVEMYFFLLGNSAIMPFDLASAVLTEQEGGIIFSVKPEGIITQKPIVIVTDFSKFVLNDSVLDIENRQFPSNGLYFFKSCYEDKSLTYTSKLTFPCYQTITKKIDPELVDMDWYAGKLSGELDLIAPLKADITDQEIILAPDTDLFGNPITTTYVKVSEATPTIEELRQGTYIGDEEYLISELIALDTTGATYLRSVTVGDTMATVLAILWPVVLVLPEDATLDDKWDGSFHTKGTYLITGSDSSMHIYLPYVEDAAELVKLPEKFLPDTVATKFELQTLQSSIESALDDIISIQNDLIGGGGS